MNRPELYPDLEPIWNAYWELHLSRPRNGWVACPIPVSDIQAWLQIHGISDTETRVEYYDLIRSLDAAWLAWVNRDREDREVKDAEN